jgi:hypothetical protein
MAPPRSIQARPPCLVGLVYALAVVSAACGPPYVADRAKGAAVAGGGSDGGGEGGSVDTGGTGGSVVRMDSSAGTGGMLPRDSAVDPPPPPPDLAIDTAPPPPDLPADKAPATGPEGGAGKTVLVVMGYTTPKDNALKPSDTKIKMRLENRGFTVKLGDDDDPDASKAMGVDLVIITDTVGNQVAAKYTMVQAPLICTDQGLFDDLKLTGNAGTDHATANVSQIVITSMTHPLAAGIMGSVMVAGGAQAATWGNPASAATKIATIPNQANQAAIFGYDKGAMMTGLAAPAKRVGFFAGDAMTDNMNDNGWKLFDAAVDWAVAP